MSEKPAIPAVIHCVRIRARGTDQFAGLRGTDYIKARNLDAKVKRIDIDCPHKKSFADNIVAAELARPQAIATKRAAPVQPKIVVSAIDSGIVHDILMSSFETVMLLQRMRRPA